MAAPGRRNQARSDQQGRKRDRQSFDDVELRRIDELVWSGESFAAIARIINDEQGKGRSGKVISNKWRTSQGPSLVPVMIPLEAVEDLMRFVRSIPHSFDWDIDASAEVLRLMSEVKYARSIAVQGGDTTANVLMCGNQVKAIHGFVKEDTSWNVLHFLAQERAFFDHVVNLIANLECFPDLAMEMKNWNARGKDTIIFDHILGTVGGELQPATSGPVICVKWTCFAKLLSTCEITNGVSIQPDLKWWKPKALPEPRRTVMFIELLDEIQMRLQESISGVFTTMDDEFIMFPEVHWFDDDGMDESFKSSLSPKLVEAASNFILVDELPRLSPTTILVSNWHKSATKHMVEVIFANTPVTARTRSGHHHHMLAGNALACSGNALSSIATPPLHSFWPRKQVLSLPGTCHMPHATHPASRGSPSPLIADPL
ncbi:hypothetical protein H257_18719 [Aphanomyces astaci]|uniref:Uncharacterized protein n=1 Tax=Aphanomyces astaci TaxID=112090 RepID=W4FBS0_APHAT|nr:hypothetical protein H257_18719 [Aphanomyces astaci]ETV64364.1 hypothetical protein H257_18719 [Aphanomyces astaci]|eukprot:XP_009846148.1 hypothetical protein H257_18719 [Aphanomyces astaci]